MEKCFVNFDLIHGMNFKKVVKGKDYNVTFSNGFVEENGAELLVADSSELLDSKRGPSLLKNSKVVVTSDLDLHDFYKTLQEKKEEEGYAGLSNKVVLVIKKKDHDVIRNLTKEAVLGADVKPILEKDPDKKFIEELVLYGGFKREDVEKALEGLEGESLSKKTAAITRLCKKLKEEEEKRKEEEEKKKEEEKKEVKDDKEESKEKEPKAEDAAKVTTEEEKKATEEIIDTSSGAKEPAKEGEGEKKEEEKKLTKEEAKKQKEEEEKKEKEKEKEKKHADEKYMAEEDDKVLELLKTRASSEVTSFSS